MEHRICELRIEIVRLIKNPAVLQRLVPHVIDQVQWKEIKRLYDISTERANHRLLDILVRSDEPGKWKSFLDALENSHYPYLATLLKTDITCFSQQRRILEIFTPLLEGNLNPREIVDKLFQQDVIDQADKERILAEQSNSGPIAAAMILLDRIQTHLKPEEWYSRFLEALYENKYEDLVREIDPDFFEKRKLEGPVFVLKMDNIDTQESFEAFRTNDTSFILENINKYRNIIAEMIDLPSIIDMLIPTVLPSEKRNNLIETFEYDQARATGQLVDHVISTGKGQEFVHCLEHADYPHLARLIGNQSSNEHNDYFQKVIQIFATNIQQQINTLEVMTNLKAQGVINQCDVEMVMSENRRKGNIAAAVVMLDRIQTRLSPESWYRKFLHVLIETSHGHIVEMLEPDFQKNPDHFFVKLAQMDTTTSCKSVQQPGSKIEEELETICDIKQAYLQSKLKAEEQIHEEQIYMTKFIEDKCEQLRKDVKEKDLEFQNDIEKYKKAVLQLKESFVDIVPAEKELSVLKDYNPQFAGYSNINVQFERHLTLHFLKSVGYVTETRPSKIKPEVPYTSEGFSTMIPSLDNLRLTIDNSSTASTSDEGSAFLQVTVPTLLDDEIPRSDSENDEKEHEGATASSTIELMSSKQVPLLKQLLMKDIIAVPGQRLAGICEKTNDLILIDTGTFDILSKVPLENKDSNKLALLSDQKVAVMSPDLQPLSTVSFDDSKTVLYEWVCEFNKSTLASHQNRLYILCTGQHLHVFSIDTGNHDMYYLGLQANKSWHPKCAVLNASDADHPELFIADSDSLNCFKIVKNSRIPEKLHLIYEHDSLKVNMKLFIGVTMFQNDIILLDRNNNSILRISGQGGFIRGEISSSSFSDCDLVAFDQEEKLLHLISYRYNEYRKVRLVPSSADTNKVEDVDDFDTYVDLP